MKRVLTMILALVMCLAMVACGGAEAPAETEAPTAAPTEPTVDPEILAAQLAAELHDRMVAVLESDEDEFTITANCAVAYVDYTGYTDEEEQTPASYTKQYVPAEFASDNPEEIRYIVRCTHDAKVVGQYAYMGVAVSTKAYQRTLKVALEDRTSGKIVAEAEFEGGDPPETIQSGDSPYGTYPDETEVSAWVLTAVNDALAASREAALAEAQRVSENYAHSSSKLMWRMTYSGSFSVPDAEYAIANCGADWKANALTKTEEYISEQPSDSYLFTGYLSRARLMYILTYYDEFTEEEAAYAADHCGLDWKEQAVLEAKKHVGGGCSRRELIFMLTWKAEEGGPGFTEEEARYAADQFGL